MNFLPPLLIPEHPVSLEFGVFLLNNSILAPLRHHLQRPYAIPARQNPNLFRSSCTGIIAAMFGISERQSFQMLVNKGLFLWCLSVPVSTRYKTT
jgi:hypothetical protein